MTTRIEIHPANHEIMITIVEGVSTMKVNLPAGTTAPYVDHIWYGKTMLIEEPPTDVEAWIPPHDEA